MCPANGVAEAEVTAVSGGGLVGGDVAVDEVVRVDRHKDAVVVHLPGAVEVLEVGDGELRLRGEAGVDGDHVDAAIHRQGPRRPLRQRLRQRMPKLQHPAAQL